LAHISAFASVLVAREVLQWNAHCGGHTGRRLLYRLSINCAQLQRGAVSHGLERRPGENQPWRPFKSIGCRAKSGPAQEGL